MFSIDHQPAVVYFQGNALAALQDGISPDISGRPSPDHSFAVAFDGGLTGPHRFLRGGAAL